MKKFIKNCLKKLGYEIKKSDDKSDKKFDFYNFPPEISSVEKKIIKQSEEYSMTGRLRMWTLIQSIKHVVKNNIEGDIVECGVWRGGNLILSQEILINLKDKKKKIYGFDTFEGMTEPQDIDVDMHGKKSSELMSKTKKINNQKNIWAYCDIETVSKNIEKNTDFSGIKLIKGDVKNTLTDVNLPKKISILRLDTDWYESTKIELEKLYPLLSIGGILIIDDYGQFKGCKKAVDEFFADNKSFFHYIDYSCRLVIKN